MTPGADRTRAAARRLGSGVRLNRDGGDGHSEGSLASGHLDLAVETGLDDHAFLPLVPLIEEAGGVIAAATRTLHRRALALFRAA